MALGVVRVYGLHKLLQDVQRGEPPHTASVKTKETEILFDHDLDDKSILNARYSIKRKEWS
jgi:hypothetical protein